LYGISSGNGEALDAVVAFVRPTILAIVLLTGLTPAASADLTSRADGSAGSATFQGSVTLTAFAADGDRLVAVGTLSGAVADASGERVAETTGQALRLAVDRGSLRASCDLLAARLDAGEVRVGELSVRLDAIELEVPSRAGGAPLRELLCRLGEELRSSTGAETLARTLDAALDTLD
jgi:hypothetical protein